ncbi:MAG: hypothetical protein ACT4PG_03605 [Panacagrimonas sp.]
MRRLRNLIAVGVFGTLSACGGGGGGSGEILAPEPAAWRMGVFAPSQEFAAICANPRRGIDPATGSAFEDIRGSALHENNWLRSWTQELYLWYDEVADFDPASLPAEEYFAALRSFELTLSGRPKDQLRIPTKSATDSD